MLPGKSGRFSTKYKRCILREVDRLAATRGIGAMLASEGPCSSQLTCWRQKSERGKSNGLTSRKRSRKANLDKLLVRTVVEEVGRVTVAPLRAAL